LIVSNWVKGKYLTDTEVTRTYSMCTGRAYINHTSKRAVRSVLLSGLCYLIIKIHARVRVGRSVPRQADGCQPICRCTGPIPKETANT